MQRPELPPTHTRPHVISRKTRWLFNNFYPTMSIQFAQTQQPSALFTFISNLLVLLTDSRIQGQSRGQRISHCSAEVVQTFQKLSQNICWAAEPSVSIPCLFHTWLCLMQGNSNGISFTPLQLSIKQWQIVTQRPHKQAIYIYIYTDSLDHAEKHMKKSLIWASFSWIIWICMALLTTTNCSHKTKIPKLSKEWYSQFLFRSWKHRKLLASLNGSHLEGSSHP